MEIATQRVIELVKSVRPLFMDHERASRITVKGAADFVTQVDFQVQERMRRGLFDMYPQVQFMGEEKDNRDIDFSGAVWILDPVDGTTNLIHDFRCSALSLALCDRGQLELGIIYQPYRDELFLAQRGRGAFLNGSPIHVSSVSDLGQSLISIGTSPYNHDLADRNFEDIKRVFLKCSDIRRTGSAAVDLAYVACGRLEAYFERCLKPWDFAAGMLLIEEAGGRVTTFAGSAVDVTRPSDILSSNGRIGILLENELLPL